MDKIYNAKYLILQILIFTILTDVDLQNYLYMSFDSHKIVLRESQILPTNTISAKLPYTITPIKNKDKIIGTAFYAEITQKYYLITAFHVIEFMVDSEIEAIDKNLIDSEKKILINDILEKNEITIYFRKINENHPDNDKYQSSFKLYKFTVPIKYFKKHISQDLAMLDLSFFGIIPYSIPLDQFVLLKEYLRKNCEPFMVVAMISYPEGIEDEICQMPIAKSGRLSLHPGLDGDGDLDKGRMYMNTFEGESGAPVILLSQPKNGLDFTEARIGLLGIHHERSGKDINDASYIKAYSIYSEYIPLEQYYLKLVNDGIEN